jgi:hypothetical protein
MARELGSAAVRRLHVMQRMISDDRCLQVERSTAWWRTERIVARSHRPCLPLAARRFTSVKRVLLVANQPTNQRAN